MTPLRSIPTSPDTITVREREWLALDARRQALAADLRTVETAMTRIKCEVLDVLKMRGLSNEAVTEAVKRRAVG